MLKNQTHRPKTPSPEANNSMPAHRTMNSPPESANETAPMKPRKWRKWHTWFLILAAIAAPLHLAVTSQSLTALHFDLARLLLAVAYALPCIGLVIIHSSSVSRENAAKQKAGNEITERQRIENSLADARMSLGSQKVALDGFAIVAETDPSGTITYVNDMFCEVSGYAREEMIGQNHRMLNSGHHPKSFFIEMWRTIAAGNPWRGEIKNRAKDGSYYWVDTYIMPFTNAQGKVEQHLAIRRVITDQKENELAIQKANEELEKANDQLERFVYTASHDIKSPLVTIQGFLGYLKRDIQDGATDRLLTFVNRIESGVRKMNENIQGLLDLSRAGRLTAEPVDVNVETVIYELIEDHSKRILEKNAIITVHDNLPEIRADHAQITQVFDNLITNALKYGCDADNPMIDIGSTSTDEEVRFFVSDNGSGIAPEYRDKVFELFHRLSVDGEGTGIGLALVRRVAELHGGSAWVESNKNNGSIFWVSLPRKEVSLVAA